MASHESYYTTGNSVASPHPATPATPSAAPPPPPPKSRTNTPSVPPLPPHPNALHQDHNRPQSQYSAQPSPAPPPPQTPSTQFYQDQYAQQQQQPQQPPPPPPHQQQPQPHSQTFQIQTPNPNPNPNINPLPPLDSNWLPPGLKDYSTTDLQPLINNPDLLEAFAKQHPAYNTALEPLQAAITANLALAQHVSQLETQLKQLRDQTGQLLLNHTSLQTQWRRKQSEMDDALSPWGPRAMYSRLVSSINEQEALLLAVHESFVEGGGESHEFYGSGDGKATEKEVTEWVKRIREGTTTLEKRREMRQRWDEGRVGGWR